ncbi:hypothetical protein [Leucobacter chinensis]|uniref:hypothetical protein n=1 Tax=Leucobacter chinensis TaxID=2851010 RepID=UPI001C239FC0|nr:hypothetical protein [Leucobacter chinensis]
MTRSQNPPDRLEWLADLTDTRWLEQAVDERFPGLESTVPEGYAALVRIMHPFTRYATENAAQESVSWASFAQAFGLAMRPDTQSSRLLHESGVVERDMESADPTYGEPSIGSLDEPLFRSVMQVLARFTATPEAGIAAVWEGYGGLVSGGSAEMLVAYQEPGEAVEEVDEAAFALLSNAAYEALMAPESDDYGLLGEEIARGPRLRLPGRDYICFEAATRDFGDASWQERAPWVDHRFFDASPQTPNLLWPTDRAWFLVSEIDFDSTLVACSFACAEALEQAEGIEAYRIERDTMMW